MPMYEYICSNEHTCEKLMPFEKKDEPGDCSVCGEPLKFKFSVLKKTKKFETKEDGVKITYRYGKPKHTFHFRDAICLDCNEESFIDCTDESTNEYSREHVECEHCGSKNLEIKPACHNIDRFSERFPYFDRGLGVMLQSKAHRREVMRKLNVSAVDGDIDVSRDVEKARIQQREDQRVVEKMNYDFKHSPGYREYRRMKDRGWTPNYKHRRQR